MNCVLKPAMAALSTGSPRPRASMGVDGREPRVGSLQKEPAESDPRCSVRSGWGQPPAQAASSPGLSPLTPTPCSFGDILFALSPFSGFSVPQSSWGRMPHPLLQMWTQLWFILGGSDDSARSFSQSSHLFPMISDLRPLVISPHSSFLQSEVRWLGDAGGHGG